MGVIRKKRPSFVTGYARSAAESAHPELWNGLVGAWVPALGVQGNTLFDLSGHGNQATLQGMDPTTDYIISNDKKIKSYGLDFDGIDDYLQIASSDSMNPANDITISVWLKTAVPDGGDGASHTILINEPAQYALNILSNGNFEFNDFDVGDINVDVGDWGDVWHHLAVTTINTASTFYFDSVVKATGTTDRTGSTNSATYIGSLLGTLRHMNGTYNNIFMYSRGLSDIEVKTLFGYPLAPLELKRSPAIFFSSGAPPPSERFLNKSVLSPVGFH